MNAPSAPKSEAVHSALLPCPSCGSENVSYCGISVRPFCADCGHGPTNYGTKARGIAAWNASSRRANAKIDADAALRASHDALREALAGLLNDTQHKDHDCGDEKYCPVLQARAALAAAKEVAK